jgi:hypothetical protein
MSYATTPHRRKLASLRLKREKAVTLSQRWEKKHTSLRLKREKTVAHSRRGKKA